MKTPAHLSTLTEEALCRIMNRSSEGSADYEAAADEIIRRREVDRAAAKVAVAMRRITGECGKCQGTGYIRGFSHISNGVCFWCKGAGKLTVKAAA